MSEQIKRNLTGSLLAAAWLAMTSVGTSAFGQADGPPDEPAQIGAAGENLQALDQGPIHEAFAEPVALDVDAQPVIEREPPPPIEELPPEVKPEGNNVQWIPGYWDWSEEIEDFVWVTGLWRDVPPGREWIPGYWSETDGGYVWVSGYWGQTDDREERFLPLPPDTIEIGPSSPAPSASHFWIPGCWIWRTNGYAWRTGYWYAGQPNWIWVPSHYRYTPLGAVYVHGYWDYPLIRRGLLFAPVRRVAGFAVTVGYRWRPYSVLDSTLLLTSLFVHRGHGHYYYGFGGWRSPHIHPWYAVHRHHRHFDPLFAYHRWHDGRGRNNWTRSFERDFERRAQFAQQQRNGRGDRPDFAPNRRPDFDADLVKRVDDGQRPKFVAQRRVNAADQRNFELQSRRTRNLQEQRRNVERGGGNVAREGEHVVSGRAVPGPRSNFGDADRGNVSARASGRLERGNIRLRGEEGATAGSGRGNARGRFQAADAQAGAARGRAQDSGVVRDRGAIGNDRGEVIRRARPEFGNAGPGRIIARQQGADSASISRGRRFEAGRPQFSQPSNSASRSRGTPAVRGNFRTQDAPSAGRAIQRSSRSDSAPAARGRANFSPPQRGSFNSRQRSTSPRASPGGRAQSRSRGGGGRSVGRSGGGRSIGRGGGRGGGGRGRGRR